MKKSLSMDDNAFDIIRGVCALLIYLGHFITHFNVESPVLYHIAYFVRGVPVFFMLSGFLVARSLERYDTKEFLIRRFFRIYPSLWACIILNTIIILIVYSVKPTLTEGLVYFVTQFTVGQFYTGSWLRDYGVGTPNGALWTITTDIQFYIVAIFLAKWLKNKSLKVWGVLTTLGVLFSALTERLYRVGVVPDTLYKLLSVSIFPFLFMFMFGMAVYYHKEKVIPFITKHVWLILVMYTVWHFIPDSIQAPFEIVRFNAVSTILLLFLTIGLGYRFGKHRVKKDYSYAFYLYHMIVINVIYHVFTKEMTSVLQSCIVFVSGILATCILAYIAVNVVDCKIAVYFQKKALQKQKQAACEG